MNRPRSITIDHCHPGQSPEQSPRSVLVLLCTEDWGSAAASDAWWLQAGAQHRDSGWCLAGTLLLRAVGGLHLGHPCGNTAAATVAWPVVRCRSTWGAHRISEMGLSLVVGAGTLWQLQWGLMVPC